MTSMTESSQAPLLKTEALGGVKTPAARREQLLDEFERSGTSGQKFAVWPINRALVVAL